MATRCGDMDPGLLLWAHETLGMSAAEIADSLTNAAGLLGMTGTADMRLVVERAAGGDADAALALEVYMHRLRGSIARMTASLGGLDVLVFTGRRRRERRGGAQPRRRGPRVPGRRARRRGERRRPGRSARSAPPAQPSGPWSSPRARTSRSRARPGGRARALIARRAAPGGMTPDRRRRAGSPGGPPAPSRARWAGLRGETCRADRAGVRVRPARSLGSDQIAVASAGSGSANRTVER